MGGWDPCVYESSALSHTHMIYSGVLPRRATLSSASLRAHSLRNPARTPIFWILFTRSSNRWSLDDARAFRSRTTQSSTSSTLKAFSRTSVIFPSSLSSDIVAQGRKWRPVLSAAASERKLRTLRRPTRMRHGLPRLPRYAVHA